jgi:hypothetical protein
MAPALTPAQPISPESRPVLDLGAAVHDHLQARGLRLRRGLLVAHAELHPDDLDAEPFPSRRSPRAQFSSAAAELRKMSTMSTGPGHLGQRGVDALAENLLAGEAD